MKPCDSDVLADLERKVQVQRDALLDCKAQLYNFCDVLEQLYAETGSITYEHDLTDLKNTLSHVEHLLEGC